MAAKLYEQQYGEQAADSNRLGWCRKKAEAQLKKILLKHFPADLDVKNGSRGYERAFREMLWASEASKSPAFTKSLHVEKAAIGFCMPFSLALFLCYLPLMSSFTYVARLTIEMRLAAGCNVCNNIYY